MIHTDGTQTVQARRRFVWPAVASPYDGLAVLLLAVATALVLMTFHDYGITTDEYVQQVYGEKLWAYYLSGFADRSVFAFRNLHLYGGLFDMVAVALQQISPFEAYATRHLLSGLIGVTGLAGTWLLARHLIGARGGLIALALLAFSASWYGAMFNNTKDIPFAVGMTWTVCFGCRLLPRLPAPPIGLVAGFGIAAGLTVGMRIGVAFAIAAFAIALMVWVVNMARRKGLPAAATQSGRALLCLLPAAAIALLLMALFWPWSVQAPGNVLAAVQELTHWPFPTTLGGRLYAANDLPPYYLPVYLLIKVPEAVLAGLLIAAAFAMAAAWRHFRRGGNGASPAGAGHATPLATDTPSRQLEWLMVSLATLLPLAYVVLADPSIYNGMRHFFFLLPPLCIGAAWGIEQLWRRAERRARLAGLATAAILIASLSAEAAAMISLHPHQYVYFNQLVGGLRGAFRQYELDYWSNFMPEALAQLERQLRMEAHGRPPTHTYSVAVCTDADVFKAYRAPNLVVTQDWQRADFIICTTNTNGDLTTPAGRTIIEIERDGTVLGVVKDRRAGTVAQLPIR